MTNQKNVALFSQCEFTIYSLNLNLEIIEARTMESKSEIFLYLSSNGDFNKDVTLQDETVWLTRSQ